MPKEGENVTCPRKPERRAYRAPKLAAVDLAADEVLARGCKVTSQNAIGASICDAGSCFVKGS